ncbi:MAG TPA: tetratricopeptide repeat protein [Verrucomicrobiae bacterium]|nr:tetratricopeptide repeat protein [Verrucomicrobiae bacterium]
MTGPKENGKTLALLTGVCVLVVSVYGCLAHPALSEMMHANAAEDCYNLLTRGFLGGQLHLKKSVPPGLTHLQDPYDPVSNVTYRYGPDWLDDLSYYKGELYLYFGVTPALLLFWPVAALTGRYLSHEYATVVFCAAGFLTSAAMLYAFWKRYFAEVSAGVLASGVLALGLATGAPIMMARCAVYEVAISCGHMLVMLALAAVWCALHFPRRRWGWLAMASLAYGLALGARPSLLPGAIILFVPVWATWRRKGPAGMLLTAALGPITLIGLGLLFYNAVRFDNPFEFGMRYQLALDRQHVLRPFSPSFLWFNFRMYFLQPMRWSVRFPFVEEAAVPSVPTGHGLVEAPFGVLANVPIVWLALAAPIACRRRPAQVKLMLGWFLVSLAILFVAFALVVGLYYYTCGRYEMEILPPLVLLAVAGIFGLERTLAAQRGRKIATRWIWGLLLALSVAFNVLASVLRRAEECNNLGTAYAIRGEADGASTEFSEAIRLKPDFTEARANRAKLLVVTGRPREAIAEYEALLRIAPDVADTHSDLGIVLASLGEFDLAIEHYQRALQINPGLSDVHYDLAVALMAKGRIEDAIAEYRKVVRMKPDPVTYGNLAIALLQVGKVAEAAQQYELALALQPNDPELHHNFANILARQGQVREARAQYELALKLKPDFTAASNALARLNSNP